MDIFERYKVDKDFVLATHVFADVAHFRKLLQEFPWNSQPDWVHQGLLESTLIKARALSDFLISDPKTHSDDFRARSMVSNWVQSESDFVELRNLVNKQIAHFAHQRFIENQQNLAISSDHLFVLLEKVNLVFSRFEIELKDEDSELYIELTSQFQIF
jgi:hypothetical protein